VMSRDESLKDRDSSRLKESENLEN